MASLTDFTKKFSKQISIRNELTPIAQTLNHILKNEIIERDELLNDNYHKSKKIIDDFLRDFINRCLKNTHISCWSELAEALKKGDEDNLEKLQDKIRERIVSEFENFDLFAAYSINKENNKNESDEEDDDLDKGKTVSSFEYIFKKNLFKQVLPAYLGEDLEKLKIISWFDNFFSYFRGFIENRKNIFTSQAIPTSIPYRIVHDNFPKYLQNITCFNVWQKECPQLIQRVEKSLKENKVIEDNKNLAHYFSMESYDYFLSQEGIDLYNRIIGGLPASGGQEKIQGLNEFVNLECQKDTELKAKLKNRHAFKMAVLYKQILSDKEKTFVIDEFESDTQVIEAVKNFFEEQCSEKNTIFSLLNLTKNLENLSDEELRGIYIQGKYLSNVSQQLYSDWYKLRNNIEDYTNNGQANKDLTKKVKTNKGDLEKAISKYDFSLSELNSIVPGNTKFSVHLAQTLYKAASEKLVKVNDGDWPKQLKNSEDKQKLKEPLDALLEIHNILQIFKCKSFNKDSNFYVDYDRCINELSNIIYLYNKTRNYCTKKPYSTDKFKLNFNSPQLGEGFSKSKENDCLTVMFKKNEDYFVGIIRKGSKINFDSNDATSNVLDDCIFKMNYNLLKDAKKFIPKCSTQLKEVKAHFKNSDEDYVLSDKDRFAQPLVIKKSTFLLATTPVKGKIKKFQKEYSKENPTEYRKALNEWISFCKEFLKSYKTATIFDFTKLKKAEDYADIVEFYKDVDNLCYKIKFEPIRTSFVEELVNKGDLYLFKIKNKDFSSESSGTKNLHTLYFQAIFDDRNIINPTIMLNGGAELFYRKGSIEQDNLITHKEGSLLVNKVCKDGTTLNDNIRNEIYQYVNKYIDSISEEAKQILPNVVIKKATHDITKDKRFTSDKFFFHCPITINYREGSSNQFNSEVLTFLRNNPDINIIGIDRGERNLIYVTVINQKGEIIDSISFNSVKNTSSNVEQSVDYEEKLALREKERKEAKRSWDSISKIATLKEGYLSAIIHEICLLMVKHNAIVVLENLNTGFKRIRGGLSEKSVYQKFEKMLINKLNYFVLKKESDWNKPCGLLNGLQLSDQFQSFEKLGIQSGFIFYVPAAYTSKIDPTTGFANILNLSKVSNVESIKKFFSSFTEISYVKNEDLFKFSFNLDSLSKKGFNTFVKLKKAKWDVFTFGERIIHQKNDKGYRVDKRINLTEEMRNLLNDYKVSYDLESNLISKLTTTNLKDGFWKELFFIFKTTLQLRNSVTNGKEDVLISPVKNSKGEFFVSGAQNKDLPQDCDSNGAYHIALKGLMILERNNLVKDDKETRKIMAISNVDWFEYVQKRSGILN